VNARHMHALQPSVLSFLFRVGSEQEGLCVLEHMLITRAASVDREKETQARSELDKLKRLLLDDAEFESDWKLALLSERGRLYKECLELMSPTGRTCRDRILLLCLKPAWQLDVLRIYEHVSALAQIPWASSSFTPALMTPRGGQEPWSSRLYRLTHQPSLHLLPNYSQLLQPTVAHLERRRLAAIAVAIYLFEYDHGSPRQPIGPRAALHRQRPQGPICAVCRAGLHCWRVRGDPLQRWAKWPTGY